MLLNSVDSIITQCHGTVDDVPNTSSLKIVPQTDVYKTKHTHVTYGTLCGHSQLNLKRHDTTHTLHKMTKDDGI
jgi:hypothetical protein